MYGSKKGRGWDIRSRGMKEGRRREEEDNQVGR